MKRPSFRKTRIAPTPSGFLHAGNAFNFLLIQALAKECGASILLRIDNGDRERYRAPYAQHIFDTLHALGIQYNEGPNDLTELEQSWSQRYRLPLYNQALQQLADTGAVFACTCSRTEWAGCLCAAKHLSLSTPGAAWRLHTNDDVLTVNEWSGTKQTSLPSAMKNFIVRKRDGLPAYQLCSVIDDVHFGVDLIVRGEDLWASTLAQLHLATVLQRSSFPETCFVHHPLLTNDDGTKLSKSAGNYSVSEEKFDIATLTKAVSHFKQELRKL